MKYWAQSKGARALFWHSIWVILIRHEPPPVVAIVKAKVVAVVALPVSKYTEMIIIFNFSRQLIFTLQMINKK